MTLKFLAEAFSSVRASGESAVLATVTQTQGSTYTKTGAQMLIGPDGVCHGLLSGGCLEGDLAERGSAVRNNGVAQAVTFDMRNRDHDEIWGLGLGCDGAMHVLLSRISPDNDYAPFAQIANAVAERRQAAWALVIESSVDAVPAGASAWTSAGESGAHGLSEALASALDEHCAQCLDDGQSRRVELEGGAVTALVCPVPLPPQLLIAGAGPDVVPVLRFATELGWSVVVVDHRPAYVTRLSALRLGAVHLVRPDSIGTVLDVNQFDAALIMSHHLASDRDYLRSIAPAPVPYVGLLGPTARRERLLDDLGGRAGNLAQRLYAPVGLDIGAQGPAGIALAAVAQIYAVINGREGAHFHALAGPCEVS